MNIEELLEDVIKSTEYNLEEKYKLFNKLYFYNLLPTIPLSYSKSKTVGGQVKARYTKALGGGNVLVQGSLSLTITNLYKRTEEQFDAILLHEMIHVYFIVNGNFTEQHGRYFNDLRKEISEKSGIDIPLTDNISDLELESDKNTKMGVILLKRKDGRYSFALISKKNAIEKIQEIERTWISRLSKYGDVAEISIHTIESPLFTKYSLKYPVQRNLTKLGYYKLPDGSLDELLSKGEKILDMRLMEDFTVKVIK